MYFSFFSPSSPLSRLLVQDNKNDFTIFLKKYKVSLSFSFSKKTRFAFYKKDNFFKDSTTM